MRPMSQEALTAARSLHGKAIAGVTPSASLTLSIPFRSWGCEFWISNRFYNRVTAAMWSFARGSPAYASVRGWVGGRETWQLQGLRPQLLGLKSLEVWKTRWWNWTSATSDDSLDKNSQLHSYIILHLILPASFCSILWLSTGPANERSARMAGCLGRIFAAWSSVGSHEGMAKTCCLTFGRSYGRS